MIISNPHPLITVYDNVFDFKDANLLYLKCFNAPFFIGWADKWNTTESFLHSPIDSDMWANKDLDKSMADFLDTLSNCEPYKNMVSKSIERTIINLDTVADSHSTHIHGNQEVLLYYANLEWQDSWGGETLFYDDSGENVIFTSPYKPNRIIKFDGEIPHRFTPPSANGPKYRLSISTFYWKELDKT